MRGVHILHGLCLLFLVPHVATALKRVLFGSCNRQNKPQTHWATMGALDGSVMASEAFLWTGDSVYAKNNTLDGLRKAYGQLLGSESYREFVESTRQKTVDGIWDDHDFGVNDAGSLPDRVERAELFAEFLGEGFPVSGGNDAIRQREGLYHVRDFDARDSEEGGGFLKVIFLDTRYARDQHYIPSLGQINFPLTALIAAAIRTAYSFFGFGAGYAGSVLGEKQWRWLEQTLAESVADGQADYHVIVSSIQVLTTNPAVESWGHFPMEKSRLLGMLARHNPKGVLLLSGDVHHGEVGSVGVYEEIEMPKEDGDEEAEGDVEVAKGEVQECTPDANGECVVEKEESRVEQLFGSRVRSHKRREAATKRKQQFKKRKEAARDSKVERGRLFEVTSSGLTHTCGDGLVTGLLCPLMLNTFTRHRRLAPQSYDGYFIGRNFGQLLFDNQSLAVSVRALPDGEEMLRKVVLPEAFPASTASARLLIKARDFYRVFRDAGTVPRVMIYVVLQYYVYRLLKWVFRALRERLGFFFPSLSATDKASEKEGGEEEGAKNEDDDAGGDAETDVARVNPAVEGIVPNAYSPVGHDDEQEGHVDMSNVPHDDEAEMAYWKRRLYEGKDVPNEVSTVLEQSTGADGVSVTKKATVGNAKKKTIDVEYVFDMPETSKVTMSQPGVPAGFKVAAAAPPPASSPSTRGMGDSKQGKRLFFGVSLPPSVKALVEESTKGARAMKGDEGDPMIKWNGRDGFHCTVRFIGETPEKDIPGLIERMTVELDAIRCGPFDMNISGAGSFPSGGRPRVLWAGLDEECLPFLMALRQAADKALQLTDTDDEELKPHVTVARCNANKKDPTRTHVAASKYLADNQGLRSKVFKVASVELYLSESASEAAGSGAVEEFAGRAGSAYSVLHSFPLDAW